MRDTGWTEDQDSASETALRTSVSGNARKFFYEPLRFATAPAVFSRMLQIEVVAPMKKV
jgi:hypothetical protein